MAFFARCKSLYYFLVSQRHCCSLDLREKGFVDLDRNLVLVSLDYWITGLFEKYFKFQVNVLVILSVKGGIMAVNNLIITTVVEFWQKYAFVSFLQTHNIWGPFLVVAPASTLHNWQQEVTRFIPQFKVFFFHKYY